jgi:hypothetical protein
MDGGSGVWASAAQPPFESFGVGNIRAPPVGEIWTESRTGFWVYSTHRRWIQLNAGAALTAGLKSGNSSMVVAAEAHSLGLGVSHIR